jgi:hypothetical protein
VRPRGDVRGQDRRDLRAPDLGAPPRRERRHVHLRRALYLPAIVAVRANPTLRAFAERLRAKGKPATVVIVAVMRKLLLLAWTLLRTGRSFAATEPLPRHERADDADQTCAPVPVPAITHSAGG